MIAYGKVSSWAISRADHYMPNALNEFLDADEADAFIVAYALSDLVNRVVVTQEKSDPARKNKVKIPEACNALNVHFVNTMDMFRQLGENILKSIFAKNICDLSFSIKLVFSSE